jgi:hypothetical protein
MHTPNLMVKEGCGARCGLYKHEDMRWAGIGDCFRIGDLYTGVLEYLV